jgi:hypothetical protein
MKFAQVTQSLNHVLEILQPLIQANHIKIDEAHQEISWRNRIRGIIKDVYYPIEYQHLIDTRQYSLLLSNGSFLQFYYGFDEKGAPKSVRLAYYPSPVSTKETVEDLLDAADDALDRSEDELYEHLFNWVELIEGKDLHPANTSHVRFDYDDNVKVHEKAHMMAASISRNFNWTRSGYRTSARSCRVSAFICISRDSI